MEDEHYIDYLGEDETLDDNLNNGDDETAFRIGNAGDWMCSLHN